MSTRTGDGGNGDQQTSPTMQKRRKLHVMETNAIELHFRENDAVETHSMTSDTDEAHATKNNATERNGQPQPGELER